MSGEPATAGSNPLPVLYLSFPNRFLRAADQATWEMYLLTGSVGFSMTPIFYPLFFLLHLIESRRALRMPLDYVLSNGPRRP